MHTSASALSNGITGIDHPLVAVSDLERARATYERLGFVVPPRGSHVEWGTGNWCIMFERDYLELRGILDTTRPLQGLDRHFEMRGEGIMGVAFGTRDARASERALKVAGVAIGRSTRLTRNFELPDGWVQPRFALSFPRSEDVIGLMHVVLCQHLTPDLLRRPEFLRHPNGAVAVAGMAGTVDDLDAVEAVQRRLLGETAVERYSDRLVLRFPSGQTLELLDAQQQGGPAGLLTIRIAVSDIGVTRSVLSKAGVPVEPISELSALRVEGQYACGGALEFVPA